MGTTKKDRGVTIAGKFVSLSAFQLPNDVQIIQGSGAPTNGVAGTGVGKAGPGSLYIDYTNAVVYQNTNTKASPTWSAAGLTAAASAADGLGSLGVARVTYNPTATAGERTVAAHALATTLPINAIVVGGFMQVNTAFTSTNSTAQVAISVEGANDIQTAAAVSGAPWSTIGKKAIVPKANTPESTGILCTAARAITATVTVEALLGGKATILLLYVIGAAQA